MLVAYSLSNTSSSCINRSQDERGVKCATLMPWIGVKITAVAIYFITLFKHFIFLVCLFMSTMRASVGAGVNCLPIKVVWCIQASPPDADNNVEHKFEPPKVLRRSNRPTHVFPSLSKSFFSLYVVRSIEIGVARYERNVAERRKSMSLYRPFHGWKLLAPRRQSLKISRSQKWKDMKRSELMIAIMKLSC